MEEAAAAIAVSTPVRNLRLLLDDDDDDDDFGWVETKTKYLDRSLLVFFGLNSIAEGPERPKKEGGECRVIAEVSSAR